MASRRCARRVRDRDGRGTARRASLAQQQVRHGTGNAAAAIRDRTRSDASDYIELTCRFGLSHTGRQAPRRPPGAWASPGWTTPGWGIPSRRHASARCTAPVKVCAGTGTGRSRRTGTHARAKCSRARAGQVRCVSKTWQLRPSSENSRARPPRAPGSAASTGTTRSRRATSTDCGKRRR